MQHEWGKGIISGKLERKLGRPIHRYMDNIKMDLR
jgi:hypothetical protein